MAERELTFVDLILLEKIEKDTPINALSGILDATSFETANFVGLLKIKGFVDITPSIGRSTASRTQVGEEILSRALLKSGESLDEIDYAILKMVAVGGRDFDTLAADMRLSSDALAYHLYKLVKQEYLDYAIKGAKVSFCLTESGFKLTGVVPKTTVQTTLQQTQMPSAPSPQTAPATSMTSTTPTTPIPAAAASSTIVKGTEGSGSGGILNAALIESDATSKIPSQNSQSAKSKLSTFDKVVGKLSFYLGKYAFVIIAILILIAVGAYFVSQGILSL